MDLHKRRRFGWVISLLVASIFCTSRVEAQNVTIGPATGNFLTAQVDAENSDAVNDIGSYIANVNDFNSTWVHKQLPLVMVSTHTRMVTGNVGGGGSTTPTLLGYNLTRELLPNRPNNNFRGVPGENSTIYIAPAGKSIFVVRLPKGFRITSYRIVFERYTQSITDPNNPDRFKFTPREEDYTFKELTPNSDTYSTGEFDDAGRTITVPNGATNEFVLSRTSLNPNDMGSALYFSLESVTQDYPIEYGGSTEVPDAFKRGAAIKIKYIELTYTPENAFTVAMVPPASMISDVGTPHIAFPYATGVIDFGKIEPLQLKLNTARKPDSYYFDWTEDMKANIDLYDAGAVNNGNIDDAADLKNIKVENVNGKNYFRLEPGRTYVLEAPTYANAISEGRKIVNSKPTEPVRNLKYPIYYRLKKVKFYATAAENMGFVIHGKVRSPYIPGGVREGNLTLLEADNRVGYVADATTTWNIDSEKRIYTVVEGTKYYLKGNFLGQSYYDLYYTSDSAQATKGFEIEFGNIYLAVTRVSSTSTTTTKYYMVDATTSNGYATLEQLNSVNQSQTATIVSGNGESNQRTLTVYSRDGKSTEDFVIDSNEAVYTLDELNNDAVKFSVPEGGRPVYVNFDVNMEVLNPYVDRLTITAFEGSNFVARTFFINDFNSVGNVFTFHAPTSWEGKEVGFVFDKLSTRYADDTYGPLSGPGSSRYSFVKSPYFDQINGDFYGNADKVMDYSYVDKVKTNVVGKQPFKFTNVDDMQTEIASKGAFYFTPIKFTMDTYGSQTGAGSGDANFGAVKMTPGTLETPTEKNIYLITTDETRYNIAPTTATEHRAYAFYETKIQLAAVNYERIITYHKLFDSYSKRNNKVMPFYGVKVTTEPAGGVIAVDDILYDLGNNDAAGGVQTDQILYGDLSEVGGVVLKDPLWIPWISVAKANQQPIGHGLNPNLMMFVPEGMGLKLDNMVTREPFSTEKTFKASGNIVLTDGEPFASPYPIQVDYEGFATYKREKSLTNNVVRNATLMLPFNMVLSEGKHRSEQSDNVLSFYQMAPNDAVFTKQDNNSHEIHMGAFLPVEATSTTAHTPYMVKVDDGSTQTDNVSFALDQRAATIAPNITFDVEGKPTAATTHSLNETSTIKVGEDNITLTNKGSYIGTKFRNIYYFGNDYFWNSATYRGGDIMVLPFRAFYEYPGTAATASRALTSFGIHYGEPEHNGVTTSVATLETAGLRVFSANGVMTFSTQSDCRVDVVNLAGQRMSAFQLKAGEQKSVSLPLGVYVVNGKKCINR